MTVVDTPLHGIAAVLATADECHHLHFRSLSPSTCAAMHNAMKLTKIAFRNLVGFTHQIFTEAKLHQNATSFLTFQIMIQN
jgi:hypothetical protein